jgi:hypothetical protein
MQMSKEVAFILLLGLAATSVAQDLASEHARFNDCTPARVSDIGKTTNVVVQKVILGGKWGSNVATAFIPMKKVADGGVVLSHSAIHTEQGATIDLAPLALTLARAGSAVIVADGTIQLPASGNPMNREAPATFCAAHWLLDHVQFDRDGSADGKYTFAFVGPRLCDQSSTSSNCTYSEPFNSEPDGFPGSYHRHAFWVPVAETEGGDNTQGLIADGGLLRIAQSIQRTLGLAPVSPIVFSSSPKGR